MAVAVALITPWATAPAEAACQLIKATHSADSQAEAAQMSRTLALQSAADLKRAKGWSHVSSHSAQSEGRSVLEGRAPGWSSGLCAVEARRRHPALLHHLLHRRCSALRLHHGFERLRPVTRGRLLMRPRRIAANIAKLPGLLAK